MLTSDISYSVTRLNSPKRQWHQRSHVRYTFHCVLLMMHFSSSPFCPVSVPALFMSLFSSFLNNQNSVTKVNFVILFLLPFLLLNFLTAYPRSLEITSSSGSWETFLLMKSLLVCHSLTTSSSWRQCSLLITGYIKSYLSSAVTPSDKKCH